MAKTTANTGARAAGCIQHHGAVDGVTGSCHQLNVDAQRAILIDCGLFQGAETSPGGSKADKLAIDFDISGIKALIATHVHIDHVGRIPYLFAAGFRGPIYCSEPSAALLPLVMEDALRVGITRDRDLIDKFLRLIRRQLRPLAYGQWQQVIDANPAATNAAGALRIRLQRAGHILGSAYVECELRGAIAGNPKSSKRFIFSGDLGAPHTPLLYAPHPPRGCDELVIESTYGDRLHQNRKDRINTLQRAIERALQDNGSVLIPAFSIGRTQELLYELEGIIYQQQQKAKRSKNPSSPWHDLPVIVDSPLASRFTKVYRRLQPHWDREAKQRVNRGRHPLSFAQLITVDEHSAHEKFVRELANSHRPAIVIAASGMCAGGRIMNYLKAMLAEARHNILFVGYQAKGTPGRAIQQYGPSNGYVELDGQRYTIRAGVETISGYSAHADQNDLLNFVRRMHNKPHTVRIVHGDDEAKLTLKKQLLAENLAKHAVIPTE